MHTPSRHRLFVAVPIFVCVVLWSMVGGLRQAGRHVPRATLIPAVIVAGSEARAVEVPGGVVRLSPGAIVDVQPQSARLLQGSALVLADGWLTLEAADFLLTGWAGGFHVSVDGERISVAAISTPVHVEREGGSRIVPVRMQMFSQQENALVGIPPHFLREQLPLALSLAGRDRVFREDSCGHRLAEAASKQRAALLLPTCIHTSQEWFLLSFHPLVREHVWTLPLPEDASFTERMRRAALLPVSDRGPHAISDPVVAWWADDVAAVVRSVESGAVLTAYLDALTADIRTLDRDGYPDRARRYASRLLSVGDDAPLSVRTTLEPLRALLVAVPTLPEESSSSSPADTPLPEPADPLQLVEDVTGVLQRAGFMFTTQTHVVAGPSAAAVSDAVLGTPSGDRLLSFSYDPAADLVSRIEHDGRILPFSLSLQLYIAWVRGE